MALEGQGHTVDLFPVQNPETAPRSVAGGVGVHHVAFHVRSEAALADAYFTLQEHGIPIVRAIDHVSQKSIYFHDPDKNLLEIVWERPNALELFARGRGDDDKPFSYST
jgi:catechol-2,3-dioxygenase